MLCQIDVVLTIVPICEGYGAVGDDEAGGGKTHPNPSLYGGAYVIGGSRDAGRVRNIILCVRNNIFRAAGAFVHNSSVCFVWSLCGHNVGTGAIAGVGKPHVGEALKVFFVYFASLALPYWFTVPWQIEPLQIVHQLQSIVFLAALRVKIFYAQHPLSSLALCRKPGE
jgi:hypothetical protein